MADPIKVKALVRQWRFYTSDTSLAGTRVYQESAGGTIELPKIGDSWDAVDYKNVTLKSIETTYLNDNDNCPRIFTCTYDGVPYSQTAVINEDFLPKSMDIGGENRAYEPKTGIWSWQSGGATDKITNQQLNKRCIVANIRIYRIAHDFDAYVATCMGIAGKLNSVNFHGLPIGTVLFMGVNMNEFKNRFGQVRWNAELLFSVKSCTGRINDVGLANGDGWTYDLREDGKAGIVNGWDRPVIVGTPNKYMYEYANFAPLFEVQQLGNDTNLFQPFPAQ